MVIVSFKTLLSVPISKRQDINDVIRHLVVGTPGDVLHLVGDEHGRDVVLLLEYFGGVGVEGGCFVGAR